MDGVDDETWLHHLKRREYSRWFRENIKNDEPADAAADIQNGNGPPPEETRAAIREAIESRYATD